MYQSADNDVDADADAMDVESLASSSFEKTDVIKKVPIFSSKLEESRAIAKSLKSSYQYRTNADKIIDYDVEYEYELTMNDIDQIGCAIWGIEQQLGYIPIKRIGAPSVYGNVYRACSLESCSYVVKVQPVYMSGPYQTVLLKNDGKTIIFPEYEHALLAGNLGVGPTVYGYGFCNNTLPPEGLKGARVFIVMRQINGVTLMNYPIGLWTGNMLYTILEKYSLMLDHKMIYTDFHRNNVMISNINGQPYFIDFGRIDHFYDKSSNSISKQQILIDFIVDMCNGTLLNLIKQDVIKALATQNQEAKDTRIYDCLVGIIAILELLQLSVTRLGLPKVSIVKNSKIRRIVNFLTTRFSQTYKFSSNTKSTKMKALFIKYISFIEWMN